MPSRTPSLPLGPPAAILRHHKPPRNTRADLTAGPRSRTFASICPSAEVGKGSKPTAEPALRSARLFLTRARYARASGVSFLGADAPRALCIDYQRTSRSIKLRGEDQPAVAPRSVTPSPAKLDGRAGPASTRVLQGLRPDRRVGASPLGRATEATVSANSSTALDLTR